MRALLARASHVVQHPHHPPGHERFCGANAALKAKPVTTAYGAKKGEIIMLFKAHLAV